MRTLRTFHTSGRGALIQHLEPRLCMANLEVVPTDYGMTLFIYGTARKDDMRIVQKTTYNDDIQHVRYDITHKGHEQTFDFTAASTDPHDRLTRTVVDVRSEDDRVHAYNRDGLGVGAPTLTIKGGAGDDRIRCRDQFMYAEGGTGNDNLTGRTGTDPASKGHTYAFAFRDDSGNNKFDGSEYADLFQGGQGDDHMVGNDGDDFIQFGQGTDLIEGDAGNDTAYLRPSGPILPSTIRGGEGEDTLMVLVSSEDTPLDDMFSTLTIDAVEHQERDVRV